MDKRNKDLSEKVVAVEDRVESLDFSADRTESKVRGLEQQREEMQADIVYMKSQSMRNNLIFTHIAESENEDCEKKIKEFIMSKMKVGKECVDRMKFERVHRMGMRKPDRARNIVAKFHNFKDKDAVKRCGKELKGTVYSMYEQFPNEIVEIRRKLVPKMKEAQKEGKRAWISYDTLYIDGRSVRV